MKVKKLLAVLLAIVMVFGVFTANITSVSAATTYATVRQGNKNDTVKTLQKMLNTVSNAKLTVDGSFGPGTLTAVKNFQKANGLTADGVVGPATWTVLTKQYNIKISKITIGSGKYNPGTYTEGNSYGISGVVSSNFELTSVTVGVYKSNGTATAYVKTVDPNAKSYNISNVNNAIKFGALAAGTYKFKVVAKDATTNSKTLVNNTFTVKKKASKLETFKSNALATWVKPVRTSYLTVKGTGRAFGASRSSGSRAHAGIDYYVRGGHGVPVYAMQSGVVIEYVGAFYAGTSSVAVKHADGSVARYAEISSSLRVGDKVKRNQQIGKIKKNTKDGGTMLHLEIYLGTSSGKLTNRSNTKYYYVSGTKYQKRADLVNPEFLLSLTRTK